LLVVSWIRATGAIAMKKFIFFERSPLSSWLRA
jgi:hypothetical protein